jgi:sulfate transport system ATP-binding protein
LIEVQQVTKRFGDFVALEDVTLDVPSGSLTGLLGPSGSGKSTLLRVIAGLETPDAGAVFLSGKEATGLRPQQRGVGFVFQHYAPFKHMTVEQNVGFGLTVRKRPRREIRERVGELLRLVQLEGLGKRSRSSRRCCSSTSRSAPSTRAFGRSCASGCAGCTTRCT